MDVELSQGESEAVQKALRSYLSELRMEITDTDNPEYKRELRDERASLESAISKLSGSGLSGSGVSGSGDGQDGNAASTTVDTTSAPMMRIVRLWWSTALG
jgi:hypothetical protein